MTRRIAPGAAASICVDEASVGAVIVAPMFERIALLDPARVELAEVGETARHRVAADVDDPRLGQDQADEAGVGPIVGHLVEEHRFVAVAVRGGAGEIFLAEGARRGGVERGEVVLDALPGEVRVALHLAHQLVDVGQLGGALDRRVAAQHLLDQRRARAVHPDDEDRRGRSAAVIGPAGEEFGGEQAGRGREARVEPLGIVARLALAERIRLGIKRERRFGARRQPPRRGRARTGFSRGSSSSSDGLGERGAHRGLVGGVELRRAQIGDAPPCRAVGGMVGEDRAIVCRAPRRPRQARARHGRAAAAPQCCLDCSPPPARRTATSPSWSPSRPSAAARASSAAKARRAGRRAMRRASPALRCGRCASISVSASARRVGARSGRERDGAFEQGQARRAYRRARGGRARRSSASPDRRGFDRNGAARTACARAGSPAASAALAARSTASRGARRGERDGARASGWRGMARPCPRHRFGWNPPSPRRCARCEARSCAGGSPSSRSCRRCRSAPSGSPQVVSVHWIDLDSIPRLSNRLRT